MGKTVAPRGIHASGPYSPGVRAGPFLFISGQLPLDQDGELLRGPIEDQARRCMENLRTILAALGASFRDLVKVTIYLADMKDFEAVNKVYAEYFDLEPPARACIGVAALPKGARIEIEAIAHLESSSP